MHINTTKGLINLDRADQIDFFEDENAKGRGCSFAIRWNNGEETMHRSASSEEHVRAVADSATATFIPAPAGTLVVEVMDPQSREDGILFHDHAEVPLRYWPVVAWQIRHDGSAKPIVVDHVATDRDCVLYPDAVMHPDGTVTSGGRLFGSIDEFRQYWIKLVDKLDLPALEGCA